jgi:hypothetical protein
VTGQIVQSAQQAVGVNAPVIVHFAIDKQHGHFFGVLRSQLLVNQNVVFGELNRYVTSHPTMLSLKLPENCLDHHSCLIAEVATRLAYKVYLDGVQHENILRRL